ncbi:MAG: Lar family restriction alleviation protein [Rhabdochlamydiaceae bacterium]
MPRPCPFCGSYNIRRFDEGNYRYIECLDCDTIFEMK